MRTITSSPGQEAAANASCVPRSMNFCTIEVSRGRTDYPVRPIQSSRFLIGSGARCDLRLGGPEIPPLHSLIFSDDAGVCLESLTASPPILVNGRPITSAILKDGDQIAIGPFEMIARIPIRPAASSAMLPAEREPIELPLRVLDERRLSELSAAEIVECIEQAEDAVGAFESVRQLGAAGLLSAVEERLVRASDLSPNFQSARVVLPGGLGERSAQTSDDLERLVNRLTRMIAEFETSSHAQLLRDEGCLSALSTISETQERITHQLDALLKMIAADQSNRIRLEPSRAIA